MAKKLIDYHSYLYHQRTKHSVSSLYSESHFLDWENQPNPFRFYQGTEHILLEHGDKSLSGNFFSPLQAAKDQTISLKMLSGIFYYSLSISAWKKCMDTSWHLRVNPSAGNLHPEDTHLIANDIEGLQSGAYHYNVYEHLLEKRSNCALNTDEWKNIGIDESDGQFAAYFIVNIITWRQAWKYRSRAFRYCLHDVGHVIGSLYYVIEQFGLDFKIFTKIDSKRLIKQLALEDGDEFPLVVIGIGKKSNPSKMNETGRNYKGKINILSETEVAYPLIEDIKNLGTCREDFISDDNVSDASEDISSNIEPLNRLSLNNHFSGSPKNYFSMVRNRRSAQAYDKKTEIELDNLSSIFKKAFVRPNIDYISPASLISLFLFVHRVKGLERGLYLYDEIKHSLILLKIGNMESAARSLSLSQEIGSDSSVCFVMAADFNSAFLKLGEIGYRAAHFEAGRIGQALYLGSESLNYNSTGIGAFFDDDVNRFLRLKKGHEVIYHFSMGKAVPDERIQTLEAYHHCGKAPQ